MGHCEVVQSLVRCSVLGEFAMLGGSFGGECVQSIVCCSVFRKGNQFCVSVFSAASRFSLLSDVFFFPCGARVFVAEWFSSGECVQFKVRFLKVCSV